MLQASNLISNISPSVLEAAGLSDVDPSSLSLGFGFGDGVGFALDGEMLGGGEMELFMDPGKKRRVQAATGRKHSRGGGGRTGQGSRSLSSTIGDKSSQKKAGGREEGDRLGPLPGEERPRSAGDHGRSADIRGISQGGGTASSSRGGTAKSVELPPIPSPLNGNRGGAGSGSVSFDPELQSGVRLPDIR